ncbi:MAG: heavy metal-associated domain-containing protein [Kiritimatiellae bacterium]|nr:heavy metal-associated domain-containing protein [Kiritimatiellia bacterium]MDD5520415.1 heavy metal-associated domain-containing protein [Kiritimatiellia bacterium]
MAFILLLVVCTSCRQSDIRTVEIKVPEMKNKTCAQIVANAVGRQAGVQPDKIDVDFAKRIVIVRYDSLVIARKNIEFAIAEAGFQANEVPAKAEAVKALPPECK